MYILRMALSPASSESLGLLPQASAVIAYDGEVYDRGKNLTTTPAFYTFWWIRRGSVELSGRFGRLRVGPESGLFLSRGIERHQVFEEKTRLISLSFTINWSDGGQLLDAFPPVVYRSQKKHDLAGLGAAACRLGPDRRRSVENWFNFQSAFHAFLSATLAWIRSQGFRVLPPGQVDMRLTKIVQEIRQTPSAGPLPYGQWEKSAGLSRSQLNRLARAQLGESLHAHRDRMLAESVHKHLLAGNASVKELAAFFGFVDSAHLCHWLRRRTGATPAELRRQAA